MFCYVFARTANFEFHSAFTNQKSWLLIRCAQYFARIVLCFTLWKGLINNPILLIGFARLILINVAKCVVQAMLFFLQEA